MTGRSSRKTGRNLLLGMETARYDVQLPGFRAMRQVSCSSHELF
jgi:hypothetical protein